MVIIFGIYITNWSRFPDFVFLIFKKFEIPIVIFFLIINLKFRRLV